MTRKLTVGGKAQQHQEQALPIQRGEQALWRAVIDRALDDACGHCGGEGRYNQRERIIETAVQWFTRADIDMRFVCDLAELNAQVVRNRAVAEVEKAIALPPKRKRHKNVRHVRSMTTGQIAR